jgi:hypothetical protein
MKGEMTSLFRTRREIPPDLDQIRTNGSGLRTKPMGWVLQGRLWRELLPVLLPNGSIKIPTDASGAVTLLGPTQTQVYRRETARDSRIADSPGEVNEVLMGFALKRLIGLGFENGIAGWDWLEER